MRRKADVLIGQILVKDGVCSRNQVNFAEELKMQGDGRKIGQLLIEMGAVSKRQLSLALAKQRITRKAA